MEPTAGLDGKVSGDADTFYVVSFAENESAIKADFFSTGWAVLTRSSERRQGADFFKVVLQPEYMRKLQDEKSPIVSSPYLETCSNIMDKFKKGRLLKSPSIPIRPCVRESRPKLLYRVVCIDHPGNGLQSRGFGTIKCDSVSFMLHFYYHLDWTRRNPSPFMSTTTDAAKAANVAAKYEGKGYKDIEVLIINVDQSQWPSESTIWHVRETALQLGLAGVLKTPYFDENEYLIKDYIPASCVTRVRWEDMKDDIRAETAKVGQSRKRKRSVFESDGAGDVDAQSDGQSRRTWGLEEYRLRRKQQSFYKRIIDPKD